MLIRIPNIYNKFLYRIPCSKNCNFLSFSQMADDQDEKIGKTRSKRGVPKSVSPVEEPKRKHVYDSREHCRATRSKSTSINSKTDSSLANKNSSAKSSRKSDKESQDAKGPDEETKKSTLSPSSGPVDNSEVESKTVSTMEYIESLQSKSSSRSGPGVRYHDTSLDGKEMNLKITTWNINGLRSWLSKRSGLTFIAQDDADIYCFQEIKCPVAKVPAEIKSVPGYYCFWNCTDDAYSGVVCFTKVSPKKVIYGIDIDEFDKEPRVITMEFDKYYVINVYVPNSGRGLVRLDVRMKWDIEFRNYLKKLDSIKPIIVCGDLNVSHTEIDLANPKTNTKTAGFTKGERENMTRLLEQVDLIDVFRYLYPEKENVYTFWTYMRNARDKNIGWRLDYFLISKRWTKKICDCLVQNDVYGSDHCPVSMYLAI